MRSLFCLILLSCIFVDYSFTINDTEFIQCTSRCSQIVVSFSQPSLFPIECQDNNDNTNIYDNALVCGIDYTIDYTQQRITIDFQAVNDTSGIEDQKPGEFIVQTISLGLSEKDYYHEDKIVRKYGCNTGNDCAKNFYLNSINYLVNEGVSQIKLIKMKLHNDSLITGPGSKRRCIDNSVEGGKPSRKCPNGLCYINLEKFNLEEKQNINIQRCVEGRQPILFSEIELHTPRSTNKEREKLEYSCNKNVCNRHDIIDKIKLLITSYTNDPSKMQENKPSEIQEDQNINEKQKSLSMKQTISSSILVLFLCLIQLFI